MANPIAIMGGQYGKYISLSGEEFCLLVGPEGQPWQLILPSGKGWQAGSSKTYEASYAGPIHDQLKDEEPMLSSKSWEYYRDELLKGQAW